MCNSGVILKGEVRCLSLLGVKGLNYYFLFLKDFEKQKETEATKPEFMRVSLKKSSREVEATS